MQRLKSHDFVSPCSLKHDLGVQMGGRKMHPLWHRSRLGSVRVVVMAALIGIALMALNPATAEAQTTTSWFDVVIRAIGEALSTAARTQ